MSVSFTPPPAPLAPPIPIPGITPLQIKMFTALGMPLTMPAPVAVLPRIVYTDFARAMNVLDVRNKYAALTDVRKWRFQMALAATFDITWETIHSFTGFALPLGIGDRAVPAMGTVPPALAAAGAGGVVRPTAAEAGAVFALFPTRVANATPSTFTNWVMEASVMADAFRPHIYFEEDNRRTPGTSMVDLYLRGPDALGVLIARSNDMKFVFHLHPIDGGPVLPDRYHYKMRDDAALTATITQTIVDANVARPSHFLDGYRSLLAQAKATWI